MSLCEASRISRQAEKLRSCKFYSQQRWRGPASSQKQPYTVPLASAAHEVSPQRPKLRIITLACAKSNLEIAKYSSNGKCLTAVRHACLRHPDSLFDRVSQRSLMQCPRLKRMAGTGNAEKCLPGNATLRESSPEPGFTARPSRG